MKMERPEIPTMKKLAKSQGEIRVLRDFLTWFSNSRHRCIVPGELRVDSSIFEYLKIDPDKLNAERQDLLDYERFQIETKWPKVKLTYAGGEGVM